MGQSRWYVDIRVGADNIDSLRSFFTALTDAAKGSRIDLTNVGLAWEVEFDGQDVRATGRTAYLPRDLEEMK